MRGVRLASFIALAGIVASYGLLLAIGICVITGEWLPAIFTLLARRDLMRWLDGVLNRIEARIAEAEKTVDWVKWKSFDW